METHKYKIKREKINKENNSKFVTISVDTATDPIKDMVNHPPHYCNHPSGVECIDIIRWYCFDVGSAIKYLWRAGLKAEEGMTNKEKEIQDLNKAIWFIKDRIKTLENE